MKKDNRLLQAVAAISQIANNTEMDFDQRLQGILMEISACMGTAKGSIMLLKGRRSLQVVASTSPELIGVKQSLAEDFPSCWVVRNRAPLYVDKHTREQTFPKRFPHYKKDSFFSVPILRNNKVIGVLNVTEKLGEDLITEAEQELLLYMSGHIITAVENQRLTESLRTSKGRLQKKNLQLRKLEKLKDELFHMLVHDLKGPLSELAVNLDILSYTVSDKNRQYVEAAEIGCNTLSMMISNLLDIARLEEAKLKLIFERIEPGDLVEEALARLSSLARIKDLSFVETYSPEEGISSLYADRGILLRVLHNLLSNAIRHSPRGEIIEVGFVYEQPRKITFFVKDNGPGIPKEYQEAVFEKFVQVEKTKMDRGYSTGLGLTFCKMAVNAHKGDIRVESSGEKGSRFAFSLTLEE